MRITINLAEDALIAARNIARHERLPLGDAVSKRIRRGSAAGEPSSPVAARHALRGRFALLPVRDEIVTPQRVRDLA